MANKEWIINRPERVSRASKGAWGLVTLAAWLIFAWLVLPLIMATSLLAWAELNRHRFRGKERRTPRPRVPVERIARDHDVEPYVLDGLQRDRVISVHVNDDGWPDGLSVLR